MTKRGAGGLGVALLAAAACAPPEGGNGDWAAYLGDPASSQYSPLAQVDRGNVHRLEQAWIYRSGDAHPSGRSQIQCNPLVIGGVLYGTTPTLKLFALDAATGEERWRFDPFAGSFGGFGMNVNRGLVHWGEGDEERLFFSAGPRLYAISTRTGRPVPGFGEDGSISLHAGLERGEDLFVVSNTPGVVYRDVLVVGTRVDEGPNAAPGHVRAFDARSGELRWVFHTVPHPGEPGYETWPEDAWQRVGGANSWSGMSLDEERGWVFVPTGSASFDFYGGDRHGENLFANTILVLDALTGKRIWHYQTVRHDLWDRDLPAPPNLVILERDGRRVEAVAQITKSGHVFVLDRETGEPLFPVEERSYPASDLVGEQAWPTQVLPTKPPPFARQVLREEDLTERTPEAHQYALERFRRSRSGGQFVPPSLEGTVIFPGFDGGGEWGGAAWDAETGLLYVNASDLPWILTMVDLEGEALPEGKRLYAEMCLYCHGVDGQGDALGEYPSLVDLDGRMSPEDVAALVRAGKGRMPGFAFLSESDLEAIVGFVHSGREGAAPGPGDAPTLDVRYRHTGYHRFLDPDGYPAVKPPWGTLNAIDLNQGEIAWQVPLGELPELTEAGLPPTGTQSYGGPVVTAGGLVFIAATRDGKLRAFDKATGEKLWEAPLPSGGFATPATYQAGGRQYVVVAAGGGKLGMPSSDAWVAFALPE